jgi:hypothetical protein
MAMQTIRRAGSTVGQKPFSFSWSRIKNYEVCPKRYYETDVLKTYNDGDNNPDLQWGETVHKAMAERCQNGVVLPDGMPEHYEAWAQKVLVGGGEIFTELELAIDTNFGPAPWFGDKDRRTGELIGPQPWFRAKVDFVKKQGPIGLLVDWKTGKIVDESFQLALSAACAFAKWPDLMALRVSYVWLKEDAESSDTIKRTDMPNVWRQMWPRISALTQSHLSLSFPPKTSKMCRGWCKVVSCPNHGKSF